MKKKLQLQFLMNKKITHKKKDILHMEKKIRQEKKFTH